MVIMLSAIAYMSGAVALALGFYALVRRLLWAHSGDDAQNLATSIITRLGTLHALILALIFAQEMANYLDVVKLITNEAGAVADVYYGIKRIADEDADLTATPQRMIADYVRTVLDEEWTMLATERKLSSVAWEDYAFVDSALLHLEPANRFEEAQHAQILDDWDRVSEFRRAREAAATRQIPVAFWVLAVAGFLTVTFPYYIFSPRPAHLLMLSVFAAFNGLVFYFVVDLGDPFSGAGAIRPQALETLYVENMIDLAGPLETRVR